VAIGVHFARVNGCIHNLDRCLQNVCLSMSTVRMLAVHEEVLNASLVIRFSLQRNSRFVPLAGFSSEGRPYYAAGDIVLDFRIGVLAEI